MFLKVKRWEGHKRMVFLLSTSFDANGFKEETTQADLNL